MLDACAMIAYLQDENGAEVVEGHLAGDEECVAHVINLCEVYYGYLRDEGKDAATTAIETLRDDGVVVREDIDELFWQEVGGYKAANRVSLADCFAVALANRNDGRVLTSDHHEFDYLKEQEVCKVEFIR